MHTVFTKHEGSAVNKQQWLARVAVAAAGNLSASTMEEAVPGVDVGSLSDAEVERLSWALAEVQRRLYNMGASDDEGKWDNG